jgi:curved DNA-binding protein
LTIKVTQHSIYKRVGDHLYKDVNVDLFHALLGGKIKVNTLSGDVNVTIPEYTQNGKQLRLKGKGMPHYGKTRHGDLYVKINVDLPKTLTEEQKGIVHQLQETFQKESVH